MHVNSLIVAALAATFLGFPAIAQTAPSPGGTGAAMPGGGPAQGMQGMRAPADCSKAASPEQCKTRQEAHQKVTEACKDRFGPERRQCMHEQAQKTDCSLARNPQQCEARKQAYAACQQQTGPQFKRCVQDRMPPVDCSQSVDPARCARHQRARELCKDKAGPEHQQCLREALAPRTY